MLANTRDLDGQTDKRNPQDFALWKNRATAYYALAFMERRFSWLAFRMYEYKYLNHFDITVVEWI
jgi:hypothetical protein